MKLYGILGRIRLVAADPVLAAAETCCSQLVQLYAEPNMTVEQIPAAVEQDRFDPIRDFSVACRKELLEIPVAAEAGPGRSPITPARKIRRRADTNPTRQQGSAGFSLASRRRVGICDLLPCRRNNRRRIREGRAVAESVVFHEMLDTLSRAKGAGIPPLRLGRCRLTAA